MAQTVLVREMFEGLGTLSSGNLGSAFTSFVDGSLTKAAVGPRLSTTAAPGWSAALPPTTVRPRIDLTAGAGLPAKNRGLVGAWFRFSSNKSGYDAVNNARLLGLNWGATSYVHSLGITKNNQLVTTGSGTVLPPFQLAENIWYYIALAWDYNPGPTQYTLRIAYRTIGTPSLTIIHSAGPTTSGGPPFAVSVENINQGGTAKWSGRLGGVGLYSLGSLTEIAYDEAIIPPLEESRSWYVDTTTGNDSNSGTDGGQSWKTAAQINAAQANGTILSHDDDGVPGSGDKLYIDTAAASLDLSTELSFSVRSLQIQAAAGQTWIIVKPYRILGGWTVTGNGVYQTTDTISLCTVWEDDKWLNHPNGATYAAVQTSMESTAGSFWTDGTTLYLHPFGNTDPRSDGKVYTRSHCGVLTPAVKIAAANIWARDFYITKTCDTNHTTSAPNAGYCLGDVTGTGGKNIFEHMFLAYGGKHCHGWSADADNSDITFQDIQAEQGAIFGGAGAQTPFVSYMGGAAKTGNIHRYIRCKTVKNRGVVGSTAGVADLNASWVYSHNAGPGQQFAEIQYIDCDFSQGSIGGGGPCVALLTIKGCRVGEIVAASSGANVWTRNTFDLKAIRVTTTGATYTVRNNIFAPTSNLNPATFLGCQLSQGTWNFECNVFDLRGIVTSDLPNRGFLLRGGALNLTFRNNVVIVPTGKQYTLLENGVNTDTLLFTNNAYQLGSDLLVARNYNDGTTTANRTLGQWQVLGKDSASFNAEDLEIDNNYLPFATSPLIDAGADLGPMEDYSGVLFEERNDIGIYEVIPTLASIVPLQIIGQDLDAGATFNVDIAVTGLLYAGTLMRYNAASKTAQPTQDPTKVFGILADDGNLVPGEPVLIYRRGIFLRQQIAAINGIEIPPGSAMDLALDTLGIKLELSYEESLPAQILSQVSHQTRQLVETSTLSRVFLASRMIVFVRSVDNISVGDTLNFAKDTWWVELIDRKNKMLALIRQSETTPDGTEIGAGVRLTKQ